MGGQEKIEEELGERRTRREVEEERQEKLANLKAQAKSLDELVVSENFTVKDVFSGSYRISSIPDNAPVGVPLHPSLTGYSSRIVLQVDPEDKNLPVEELTFAGYSPVKSGDYIRAKIPRYEEKDIPDHLARPFGAGPRPRLGPYSAPDVLYFDRDLKSEETAIEVKILSEKEEVLRTDRSVDYDDFLESE